MNSTYTVVEQNDNFAVQDEMGCTLQEFSVKQMARDFIADLNACELHSHYVATTRWTDATDIITPKDPQVVDAVEEPVVETKKLVADANGLRKSDRVRARIALAKTASETQDVVIAWVIAELGMSKQLAKTYVKGNWNKV
jgi:hypothetical protein